VQLLIETETDRRYQQKQDARIAEREREEREAAALLAKTVIRSRYIEQSVRCGKAACHCMKGGQAHGAYWYRVDTYGDGRRRKRYMGKTRPKGA